MNTHVIIYYNEEKTCYHVVRPQMRTGNPQRFSNGQQRDLEPFFQGNWNQLVEGVTGSNHQEGIKLYHSYEVR